MPTSSTLPERLQVEEQIETHISTLALTDDRVYKFRKPVSTDFVDFTVPEARLLDCEREVILNRRLAPDVYLGVALWANPALDGRADACVVMRRLPADRQLSKLIEQGEDVHDTLRLVARQMAELHQATERGEALLTDGAWPTIRERWEQALEQLQPLAPEVLDPRALHEVTSLVHRWLAGRRDAYVERAWHHHLVDGHGDLRTDNIFILDDGPRILDCIEFDDHLRHLDVAADVAFLMMDLRRRGRYVEAAAFRVWYEELSGEQLPSPLLEHWIAYWALVRAKVAGILWQQGHEPARDEARGLLTFALRQLRASRPRLVLVGGLPASGKSTLAEGLGLATGWPVLATDVLRKQEALLSDLVPASANVDGGLYEPERVRHTYELLLERARLLLEAGWSVVLDGSWTSAEERDHAVRLAEDTSVELHELRCAVDPETARARLEARRHGPTPSDATVEVVESLAARADPWPSATIIDTTGSPSAAVDVARRAVE